MAALTQLPCNVISRHQTVMRILMSESGINNIALDELVAKRLLNILISYYK